MTKFVQVCLNGLTLGSLYALIALGYTLVYGVLRFINFAHSDVVTIGDFTLGRGTFESGWQWSKDVKAIAGTASCMTRHTGICLSGQMTVRSDDGTEATIRAGDVFVLEPGHDAWTVGNEPCVAVDFGGFSKYAVKR